MTQLLAEVSEEAADATVRRRFDALREAFGYGSIPLFWRVLASDPAMLDWAADVVLRRAGAVAEVAARVRPEGRGEALPAAVTRAAGLADSERRAVSAMLAAFAHANPINLTAAALLCRAARGEAVPAAAGGPAPAARADLPPVPDEGRLPEDLRAALLWLASLGGRRRAETVPTLYRYLALWPPAVGLACARLAPDFSAMHRGDRAAALFRTVDAALEARAAATAPVCPSPARVTDLGTRFCRLVPEMILAGHTLSPLFSEPA